MSDQALSERAVLDPRDVAGASTAANALAQAPCQPAPLLRKAKTAESATLEVGDSTVKQIVAVFPSAARAKRAYRALGSASRRTCILGAMDVYSRLQPAGRGAKTLPPRKLDAGEESSSMSFALIQAGSPDSHANVIFFRTGRALTEIIFLTDEAPTPEDLMARVSARADRGLAAISDQS